jgi:hypothetical protein
MGKLVLLIFAIVLVLVILPGDVRDWCLLQAEKLRADAVDFMDETNITVMTDFIDCNEEILHTQIL